MDYDETMEEPFCFWAQIQDGSAHFKIPFNYGMEDGCYYFEYGWGRTIPASVLRVIIKHDISLRECTQRIESVQREILRLTKESEDSKEALNSLKHEQSVFEKVTERFMLEKEKLYAAEFLLPEKPLGRAYHKIRENPAWYLRTELVEDCIARGGCCGRECRCCENRHLTQNNKGKWKPGTGHCTLECYCCSENRGFPLVGEKKLEANKRLRDRVSVKNPGYLVMLSEAYICPRKRFAFGKPSVVEFLAWLFYHKLDLFKSNAIFRSKIPSML